MLVQPDRQILDAVARLAGVDRVVVVDEPLHGESRSAFAVAAGDDELVVKLVSGALRQVEWSRRHSPGSADDARFMAIAEAVMHDCEAQGA